VFNKLRGKIELTQNSGQQYTMIMAILDGVGKGDLSKRICTFEFGASNQVQELSQRVDEMKY